MRILLFSGKGGVGKTSLAAATGLQLSRLGYRTLVMSVDPAHSLADAFDLETSLFQDRASDPLPIDDHLAIHEVNIQKEIKRHWREISTYVISVLRTTGISDVEAEELAILPGMEELSAMMYVNQFRREQRYDVIVLDCAPTAESMRFVSMPTTLEWYMKHIFPFQRGLLKAVRPVANRVSPVELPTDSYFANIQDLFGTLGRHRRAARRSEDHQRPAGDQSRKDGAARDPARLRLFFAARSDGGRHHRQSRAARSGHRRLVRSVARLASQDSGRDRGVLRAGGDEARAVVHPRSAGTRTSDRARRRAVRRGRSRRWWCAPKRPTLSRKRNSHYEVRLRLPFAMKGEVGLFKKGDELVVEIGTLAPAHRAADLHGRAHSHASVATE